MIIPCVFASSSKLVRQGMIYVLTAPAVPAIREQLSASASWKPVSF